MNKINHEVKIRINNKKDIQKRLLDLGCEIKDLKFFIDKINMRIIERYHQTWLFTNENLNIVIDSVPFGDYLRIQGQAGEVSNLINNLELKLVSDVSVDYIQEYTRYCMENGIKEEKNVHFFKS